MQVEPYTPGAPPGENIIWEHVSDRPSIRYQGPELNLGIDYQMIVSAPVNQALRPVASLRFQRVDDDTVTQIQATASEIEAQDLSIEAEAIVLADLYQSVAQPNTPPPDSAGLVYEAISVLEGAIADGSQTPYVHRLLGDLYLQTGLLDDAERRYQDVLEYAQIDRDGGDRATAQVGLANIAAARGDRREAEAWLQRARVSYASLGNTQQVQQVTDWISRIYF